MIEGKIYIYIYIYSLGIQMLLMFGRDCGHVRRWILRLAYIRQGVNGASFNGEGSLPTRSVL